MIFEGLVGRDGHHRRHDAPPGRLLCDQYVRRHLRRLGMSPVNLEMLQHEVGEAVAGRPGGAVSLAFGMAQIFGSLPGMGGLLDYWYHFAIMFEALFIVTTIDAGTRVGGFLVQEFGGRHGSGM